ncbi:hypothetical protein KORDIASMS9_02050 [Kordia sp. SMS9]|uniref:hypothetical protein n=1 Tax=Kordia sp. SMS9 TaxID=2282170 RepID=UPI000E0FFC23|nr:hypothetical protein [Kordia sp. SMS9]AXG69822.1 hypothetical protein KORDIASMS9_02050 [Kordia sp. SMS9]
MLLQSIGFKGTDMLQLGEFIEHASYHNEQYGDTFFEFVSKHYGALKVAHDQEHQEERKDHEKLPFQQTSQVTTITIFILNATEISLNFIEFLESRNGNFHYKPSESSLHSQKLIQPPRLS